MIDRAEKVKVLHIMSGFGGGISSFVKNKAVAMKGSEVIFDVLTYDNVNEPFEKAIKETGGTVHIMPNPKKVGFKNFYQKVNEVFKHQPSEVIVHCHIQGYRMLPFYLIAKLNSVKRVIVHAHTDADKIEKQRIENRINRLINRILSVERVSCGIKASLNIFGKTLVDRKEIMHVPNSIDSTEFLKSIDKKKKRVEVVGETRQNAKIIGSIARFHRQKNHKFMVEIIEKLSEKEQDFLWLFIGEGELKDSIQKSIKEKGLERFVKFLGRRNDISELFQIMDIFVLPSLYEGLPTVAVEAQAAGAVTYLSDTITQESDLGMSLVQFLSIEDASIWVQSIQQLDEKFVPVDEREQYLKDRKFTNEASAELYRSFLNNEIYHYEI